MSPLMPMSALVRVRLHRVRGAFDRRQVRQPSLDRLHHPPVVVQDRPRLGLVPGHYHPLHMHATSPLPCATSVTCATAQEITTSTTGNPARYEALSNIEDTSAEAGDNGRRGQPLLAAPLAAHRDLAAAPVDAEIGRASCRERV